MSRFGLRSASDVLKQSDDKPNRRKTCNPVSISMKQSVQVKNTKYLTNINEESIIDDIKIEIEDVERGSDIVDGLPRNKSINGGEDEDEEDEGEYIQQPQQFVRGLICSLPLDRISDVIQKLNLTKSNFDKPKQYIDKVTDDVDESVDNDDDEDDDNTMSCKQSTSATKNLCLYCDKKFSSHKMQQKHVEKFHCLQQDRRCSGRKSQLQQTQGQAKRKTTIGSQNFPGCTFCQKNKCLSPSIILPSSDLSALFVHLADSHPDKYFGCKMCVMRFQNLTNLSKHMEVIHKILPFAIDESSCKSRDNDTDSLLSNEKSSASEKNKISMKRQQRLQKTMPGSISNNSSSFGQSLPTTQCPSAMTPNTSVIGAEEPILSRLGLTQNRLPNNRKGVRLRREKLLPELLLKSEQNNQSSNNFVSTLPSSSSSVPTICSPKLRGKAVKTVSSLSGDTLPEVIFRVPTRNDFLSCVFDDNFYKEVVSNVRNNLLFHLDGKIMGTSSQSLNTAVLRHVPQPHIRSTLVKSPIVVTTMDSEIHAATSLAAVTAFPTLLTAAQFGGDGSSSKLRRPHTKNSWKWKWDSVKKFKLVNEGGKIVKKMKHPIFGLRDLSKLDMWTQLTMRKKREMQQQQQCHLNEESSWSVSSIEIANDPSREEKQRLNDQLNMILDMRLLPHIILEQNEQAIIKLENDEFGIGPFQDVPEDSGDNLMAQTFSDENFLSMLHLLPNMNSRSKRPKLVLSGEWARPRCYLCMCCGAKFEKQKSLEEHKMFRHSQILSTHYEVVGRELLNGNLLRHLFLPKKALSRYANEMGSHQLFSTGAARRLFWHKNEALVREITNNDESSDSLQSMLNSCTTNSPSIKNSSSTEDCDTESKIATAAALDLMPNNTVVSPTHSIQSCSSLSSSGLKSQTKIQSSTQPLLNVTSSGVANGCSKCGRKCSGILDLYRHMLDCSGDYVWSLAKKRKYRYYCGSKKRRPCNKHSILELRKNKTKQPVKIATNLNESTEEGCASTSGNFPKTKTSPRPRPSDAESIKKMLENLPPKRVCKKIFPTLSKAKKNTKNIKPKLLAKHKIYNSLRKTRVRQMSQAAKILSKTKSQLKKSIKMTTRSSAAPSSADVTNKTSNKKNKLKMLLNKNTKTKSIAPKEAPICEASKEDEVHKEEVQCSIKDEIERDDKCLLVDKDVQFKKLSEDLQFKTTERNSPELVTSLQPNHNKDRQYKTTDNTVVMSPNTLPIPSVSQSNVSLEASQKCTQKEPAKPGQLSQNVPSQISSNTCNNLPATCDTNQNLTNNKNIKRSKRISDCIAMLTGKLEQKLKTEKKVTESATTSAKPFANIIPQATGCLPPAVVPIRTAPQMELSALQSVEVAVDVGVADKAAPCKKTPKRKAISRRIIKTDGEELSGVPATPLDSQMKVAHSIIPVATKSPEILSAVNDGLLATMNITQKIHTIAPTDKIKTLSEPIFSQIDGSHLKSIPPAALIPPMPSIMPLNNQSLISNVPLYIPVDSSRPPNLGQLPLSLPMPIPAPPPIPLENLALPSLVEYTTPTAASAIPLVTAVPPAHLPPPSNITMPVTSFNIPIASEPLNLSNSSKNVQKQSQDLSCSSRQRSSGMPARRQTICGFEARNFVTFDEMEPLDLSKKSKPDKPSHGVHIVPVPIEMAPVLLPVQSSAPLVLPANLPSDATLLPVPPLTAEALLNKPFYSNLDLLRIPQVRNPSVGQVNTTIIESTPPPPSPTAAIVNNSPIAPIATNKPAVKKRNKLQAVSAAAASASSVECVVSTTTNSPVKFNYSKESSTSKKDTSAKGKVTLRMDEEVINHIDDAINSVINAVKASLDSEEAEMSMSANINTIMRKTTDDINLPKEPVAEFKKLNASRRNMRSKTLDCRPVSLNKLIIQDAQPTNIANNITSDAGSSLNQIITVKNIDVLKGLDPNNVPQQFMPLTTFESSNDKAKTSENQCHNKIHTDELTPTTTNEIHSVDPILKKDNIFNECDNLNQNAEDAIKKDPVESMNTVAATKPNDIIRQPLEKTVEHSNVPVVVPVPDTYAITANTTTATHHTNLDVEQMSNNNNTSSGFHSSAQSDQQTSVMSTNTSISISASVVVSDTKKKQRRRRKNELAAIVADQLLESFKLDKARRDNLKKLENLAYEKSEDLLLTGMLLMSSTKRNVNNPISTPNTSMATTNVVDSIESTTNNKRTNKNQQNSESSKIPKELVSTVDKVDNNTVLELDKVASEAVEINDGKKSNKRKQYRRRGKTIDNENISKLKSSLESFSIDIERQLTEYESKNVNVFKNISPNDTEKLSANSTTPAAGNAKPSVILRPSILSMTLEASVNADNPQAPKSSAANDTNKTVVSSRDPRLNKNIHKEGEKSGEYVMDNKTGNVRQKPQAGLDEIGDLEEDNYLTEIAKNVNEKIMSTENEEFAFKDDGFEMANEMGADDSNSKYSRPPTSMSVRSAPNFNDDRSNFGSICDENTNTEVMDMDLDDEMSVYTSYSQDLGRGRGRRRRRRRSILLTRKPKKRASSRDLSAEKIECILCKKVFYSANSLSKHNMTLAHVSKVSEQEYLLSKSVHSTATNIDQTQSYGTLGPYARRSTRRATISEPPSQMQSCIDTSLPPHPMPLTNVTPPIAQSQLPPTPTVTKQFVCQEMPSARREELAQPEIIEPPKSSDTPQLPNEVQDNDDEDANNCAVANATYNGNSRLNLNPDERLFFECCNILKSAETPRLNNVIAAEERNNLNANYGTYSYSQHSIKDRPNVSNLHVDTMTVRNSNIQAVRQMATNNSANHNQQPSMDQTTLFRDPQYMNVSNCYNKIVPENGPARSPTYSAISHLSAVTNTTSRFKTKAAMKGYENVNVDLIQHQESKSRTICKLTELAEIALGNEDKPNSHSFSPIQSSSTPPQPLAQIAPSTSKIDVVDGGIRLKCLATPDFPTLLAVENAKEANPQVSGRTERTTKNNETRSSTSSKTIMHSSIIKAAVEEHQKAPSSKIVIPERPFKNIGLEEKETITFQKPRAPAVHLLTEDNNSVSTGSFSDRDDYDFGSLSCDEEASVRESNDKIPKNNSTESSSESSRATAKTFENKSLIMGRIFKNVSTKAPGKSSTAVKKQVKSVGVQKDQAPTPKADLNQLFDELRGNSGVDGNERTGNIVAIERVSGTVASIRPNHKQQREVAKHVQPQQKPILPSASPPAIVSSTTATPATSARKIKAREPRAKPKTSGKARKDISKLQSELGMSPDEIKKLIDDGQRKSKRRCATNRPKKLVEMWSSDEYEEFLSTKDIIALIEEKEQEEKRKKRKNSMHTTSSNTEMDKGKDTSDVTSSTKEPKRRNSRKAASERRDSLQSDQHNVDSKFIKPRNPASSKKENAVSTTATPADITKIVSQKNSSKISTVENNNVGKTKTAANTSKPKAKRTPKPKQAKPSKESKSTKRKKSLNDSEDDEEDENGDDDDDEDFLIADLKNKTRPKKVNKSKTNAPAPIVTSSVKIKTTKAVSSPQTSKKRSTNNNSNSNVAKVPNVTDMTTGARGQKQSPQKTIGKRKNQTNQSPPRRKRPASEKLYYWSSSSDEDFGRINNNNNNNNNNNKSNVAIDSFDNGGEQYQKHGWIVGDSHKKLVTLLAIAKGNKKVDSKSGVKKNVPKKRN